MCCESPLPTTEQLSGQPFLFSAGAEDCSSGECDILPDPRSVRRSSDIFRTTHLHSSCMLWSDPGRLVWLPRDMRCSQDVLYPSVPHKGWGVLKESDWAWWWFTTDSDGPAGSFQRWHDGKESQVPTFKWGQEGSWVYITDCTFLHFTKTGWSVLGTRVFLWIIQSNHLA